MSFSDTELNIAVESGQSLTLFGEQWPLHKEPLPDGNKIVETICAHWDDSAHTRKRAASLHDGTIKPTVLTDGRDLWRGLWQSDVEAKVIAGEIPGVEILTNEQVAALTPPPPEMP